MIRIDTLMNRNLILVEMHEIIPKCISIGMPPEFAYKTSIFLEITLLGAANL